MASPCHGHGIYSHCFAVTLRTSSLHFLLSFDISEVGAMRRNRRMKCTRAGMFGMFWLFVPPVLCFLYSVRFPLTTIHYIIPPIPAPPCTPVPPTFQPRLLLWPQLRALKGEPKPLTPPFSFNLRAGLPCNRPFNSVSISGGHVCHINV